MTATPTPDEQRDRDRGRARDPGRWFRYSLRTVLLLMLLVSVYFAGRYASRPRTIGKTKLEGAWEAVLPAGFVQPTTIREQPDGTFLLSSRAAVLSGVYQWRDGELVVVKPNDQRMTGLIWTPDGDSLTLTAEPANTPTGSSYLGARLRRPATAGGNKAGGNKAGGNKAGGGTAGGNKAGGNTAGGATSD